jgi:hypothetical protein
MIRNRTNEAAWAMIQNRLIWNCASVASCAKACSAV